MNATALALYRPPPAIVRAWEARHCTSLQLAWHAEARARFVRMHTVGPPPEAWDCPDDFADAHWILDAIGRFTVASATARSSGGFTEAHETFDSLALGLAIIDPPSAAPRSPTSAKPPPSMIKRAVCREWCIRLGEMIGDCRTKALVEPRQVAQWLHKTMRPGDSLPRIGISFGIPGSPRHHTTILNSLRKVAAMSLADPKFSARVAKTRERIEDAVIQSEANRLAPRGRSGAAREGPDATRNANPRTLPPQTKARTE